MHPSLVKTMMEEIEMVIYQCCTAEQIRRDTEVGSIYSARAETRRRMDLIRPVALVTVDCLPDYHPPKSDDVVELPARLATAGWFIHLKDR